MSDYYKQGYVHIVFPLKQDSFGYPDSSTERLWATKLNENQFQIANIPFYVKGISYGDLVVAKEVSEDVYDFTKLHKHSGHSTFRVFISETVPNKDSVLQEVIRDLNAMGAKTEGMKESTLTAIDVPSNTDVSKVGLYLNTKYKAGLLDYEEAAVPANYVSHKAI